MEAAIRSSVPKGTDELNLGAFARGFTHGELLLRERGADPDEQGAARGPFGAAGVS